ncbi:hypothetical protein RA276_27990, partial [Pseudomonas syringae pv. tagetis]
FLFFGFVLFVLLCVLWFWGCFCWVVFAEFLGRGFCVGFFCCVCFLLLGWFVFLLLVWWVGWLCVWGVGGFWVWFVVCCFFGLVLCGFCVLLFFFVVLWCCVGFCVIFVFGDFVCCVVGGGFGFGVVCCGAVFCGCVWFLVVVFVWRLFVRCFAVVVVFVV